MYRFDKTAIWRKHILSNDNEQSRSAVKGVEFACFEQTGKVKGQATILEGASSNTSSITLQTDNPIAKEFKTKDEVEFEGEKKKVVTVGEIRSLAFKGAKEYLIGLH
jgi:hypothetical protein